MVIIKTHKWLIVQVQDNSYITLDEVEKDDNFQQKSYGLKHQYKTIYKGYE